MLNKDELENKTTKADPTEIRLGFNDDDGQLML